MAHVDKDASYIVARQVSLSPVMDAAAETVQAALKARATKHRRTGNFARSIKTTSRLYTADNGIVIKDRYVYSDDPGAMSIEYGYVKETKRGPKKVAGKHIFTNYLNEVK